MSIVAVTDIAAAGILRNANPIKPFMVFSVKYIGILEMIVLCFGMHGKDILEHINVTCHVCYIGIYLITLLNILMPRY